MKDMASCTTVNSSGSCQVYLHVASVTNHLSLRGGEEVTLFLAHCIHLPN